MIEQLESVYDQADQQAGGSMWPDAMPTADELGAEVERFLRDQPD